MLSAGLFAIAQSICYILDALDEKVERICGVLFFMILEISFVGIRIMIVQVVNKKVKNGFFERGNKSC